MASSNWAAASCRTSRNTSCCSLHSAKLPSKGGRIAVVTVLTSIARFLSLLFPFEAPAKSSLPGRVVKPAAARVEGPSRAHHVFNDRLGEPGSEQRWRQLQQLRRGLAHADGWLDALNRGEVEPAPDLLAALVGRLDRAGVEALLAGPVGQDPAHLLAGALVEWPALAAQASFAAAWLEPLLHHSAAAPQLRQQLGWLQLVGHCRDDRVARALRGWLEAVGEPEPAAVLLPLLGLQRRAADADWLLQLALDPGPQQLRRSALEAVAVGLAAWPRQPLIEALTTLSGDLDPALAAKAVDLLARLPAAGPSLRSLLTRELDPAVRSRLLRRLRCASLVLVVHGRQGGLIPPELQELALALAELRGSPVLVQALTGDVPQPDQAFWEAARRAGRCTLVPLLLLPGAHVRSDVPRLAGAWHRAAAGHGVDLQRRPFLGAWPQWQQSLAQHVNRLDADAPGRQLLWLHHPLEGGLAARYLQHLAGVLKAPGCSAPFGRPLADLEVWPGCAPLRLQPLTLAANRLSESLRAAVAERFEPGPCPELLPPLLEQQALRGALLRALTSLP